MRGWSHNLRLQQYCLYEKGAGFAAAPVPRSQAVCLPDDGVKSRDARITGF